MLAEILLCGLASMDIGLKTANIAYNDLNFNQNLSTIDADEESTNFNINGIQTIKDIYYAQNSLNVSNYNEKESISGSYKTCQLVSPSYTDSESIKQTQGFESDISGILHYSNYKYEIDYYRFYLYGDADLSILFKNVLDEGRITLYKISSEGGNLNLETIISSYCIEQSGRTYEGIEQTLNAGTYCISVTSDAVPKNGNNYNDNALPYFINIDTRYEERIDEELSIGDLDQNYEVRAIAYISDFNPFDIIPFKQERFTFSKNLPTVEASLTSFDKILHSSLIVWNSDMRDALYNIFYDVYTSICEELKEKEDTKVKLEKVAKVVDMAETVLSLFFVVFEKPIEVAVKLGSKTMKAIQKVGKGVNFVNNSLQGAHMLSGGDIPDSIAGIVESFIPTGAIMSLSEYKTYLEKVMQALYNFTSDKNGKQQVRINSYYKIEENDGDLEIKFDSSSMFKEVEYENPEVSIDSFENAIFKGKLYKIQNIQDFQDARKHIQHNFSMIPVEKMRVDTISADPNGSGSAVLYRDRYCWFKFTPEMSGTYVFASGGQAPENDSLVGELYGKVVVGRTIAEKPIVSDCDSGFDGHFVINYFLEKGETVFVRVHGKNWNTLGDIININVTQILGPHWNLDSDCRYFEDTVSFERDKTKWRYLKFDSSGYKIIQNFSHDSGATMKLFDARGQKIAETSANVKGYYDNDFLSVYVNNYQFYLLQMCVPKYAKTNKELKVSICSANKEYKTIDDLTIFERGVSSNPYSEEIKGSDAIFGVFIPELTAHYSFNVDSYSIAEIIDADSGNKIEFYKEDYHDKWRSFVACLDEGKEYYLIEYFSDCNENLKIANLFIDFYSDGEIVVPTTPFEINEDNVYFERKINNLGNKEHVDYWFSFEQSGYVIFQLFNNVGNLSFELYDIRNNLVESDNNEKGTSSSSFINYEVKTGTSYRVRIRNNSSNNKGKPLVLSITQIGNCGYTSSFNDLWPLYWERGGKYFDFTFNGYRYLRGGPGVAYFEAPNNGYYTFSLSRRSGSTPASLYVLDPSSSTCAQYGKDYIIHNGYGSTNESLTKQLVAGRKYYLVFPTSGDYDLRITEQGRELGNANENGGYANSWDINAGSSDETFSGIYIPNRTGFVCFDGSKENKNLTNKVTVSIFDEYHNEIDSVVEKVTVAGKDILYALLEEGATYVIKVTKVGNSNVKGTLGLLITYDYGSNNTEEFTVPANYEARYYEKVCTLHGTAEQYYYVTFQAAGYKIFQTFGNSDTELELYSIPYQNGRRLLRSDDNSGYERNALLSYNVEANTKYLLIVRLHGDSHTQYGQVKTSITPYNGYISNYNSLTQNIISNYSSFDQSFYLEKGFSKVILVKTYNYGNYTFNLKSTNGNSKIDTYLHVIDPSNSDKKISGVDYNDDIGSGSTDSRITKTLDANKYYYVVISSYFIADQTGYVTLSINRN